MSRFDSGVLHQSRNGYSEALSAQVQRSAFLDRLPSDQLPWIIFGGAIRRLRPPSAQMWYKVDLECQSNVPVDLNTLER